MKIDHDYLKGLLEAFEASDKSTTTILELKDRGYDYADEGEKFLFHMQILYDKQLIASESGILGFGFDRSADGMPCWSVFNLRLTASGHDFLEALRNSQVWATLKREFKDVSIGTLLKVSKDLLEGYTKKKVESLLLG
ncbi:MAG: DUF2513 domain-containing protein [Smithella sp.]